jgi:hypothetical protein
MTRTIFIFIAFVLVASCTPKQNSETATTSSTSSVDSLYQQNLAVLQKSITAFENKDINGVADAIADSAVCLSPAYGDTVTTKAHFLDIEKSIMDNTDSLMLTNADFLPGVDTATDKMDGSVRYYGTWNGIDKATHYHVKLNFYGFYNFNKDHKIVFQGEFYDVGGVMNAIKAASAPAKKK